MSCSINQYDDIVIIAGDDFTLGVDFYDEKNQPFELSEGDKCELVIHCGNDDKIYKSVEQSGNTAKFFLSGEVTKSLTESKTSGMFEYCVRITLADGTRQTPIHRESLTIERC